VQRKGNLPGIQRTGRALVAEGGDNSCVALKVLGEEDKGSTTRSLFVNQKEKGTHHPKMALFCFSPN